MKIIKKEMPEIQISLKDVKDFLREQGYDWSGYVCPYDSLFDYYRMYQAVDYKDLRAKHIVMLMGKTPDWKNIVEFCDNGIIHVRREENKFVNFARISRKEFSFYSLFDKINYFEIDDGGQKFILKKDLTAEWIEFLSKRYEGFLDYIETRCKEGKIGIVAKARAQIKNLKTIIAKFNLRIKNIQENQKAELEEYDKILDIVKKLRNDHQV